jgi:hypothetical protein
MEAKQISSDSTIFVDGNIYENEECMPENTRQAFEHVVEAALKAKRALFQGSKARFVPKLNSRIVCDSEEFGNAADLPIKQRRLYEEGLAAILPTHFAERVAEGEARLQQRNKLFVACISLVGSTSYLWYHGCLANSKFLFHFVRFLCGVT